MSFDSFIRSIGLVKELAGQEWLDNEIKKIRLLKPQQIQRLSILGQEKHFHPLAYLIYQADNQLRKCAETRVLDVDEATLRVAYLGERISTLQEKNVSGLAKKIADLKSSKKDAFDKTCYEIQVAAAYAERGRRVSFVETRSEEELQTHDLLVDGVEIECKKREGKTKRDLANEDNWNLIAREISRMCDYVGFNYFAIIKTPHDPTISDVEFIKNEIQRLIKAKYEGEMQYDNGIELSLKILSWKDQIVPASALPSIVVDGYDYIAAGGISDSPNFNNANYHKNPRIFAFKTADQPDRIKTVINAVRKAREQLTGTRPAIIYIHLNALDRTATENDLYRLDGLVRKELENNTTITAVVITTEVFSRESDILNYSHKVRIVKNQNPKHPLPDSFTIIGET